MAFIALEQRPAFCRFKSSQLIVSTYQLDSDSDFRHGALYFITNDLHIDRVIPTSAGVFRFEIVDDICISALTDGSLQLLNLSDLTSHTIKIENDMLLNVSVNREKAVVTSNKGTISLIDYPSGKIIFSWVGHKLAYTNEPCEVWSVALTAEELCTGGEDALLTFWDTRSLTKTAVCKNFDAGVTFVNWRDENILLTGSYDQNIRLLDRRNLREPIMCIETAGGVWHMESIGKEESKLYVASVMYGGVVVLDSELNIIYSNKEAGKELLYGATFVNSSTLACTTFNDYRVSLYSF